MAIPNAPDDVYHNGVWYNRNGQPSGSVTVSTVNSLAAANANSDAINAAVASGGTISIPMGLGNVYVGKTINLPSNTQFNVGAGTFLKRHPSSAGGKTFHMLRNAGCHGGTKVNGLVISGGFFTFPENGHSRKVGDQVFLENMLGTTMNGPQTITSIVEGVSWAFAASGSNPTNTNVQVAFVSKYNPLVGTNFVRTTTTATVTITIAAPGVVTWTAHPLINNSPVCFTTTGALPTGLVAGTTYYVVGSSITTNTFQVSLYPNGPAITTTGTQSGVQSGFTGTVTVTETGHSRVTGDRVYVANLGGTTTFNGAYEIVSTTLGVSWTYAAPGPAETATGTAQLLGDRNIGYDVFLDGTSGSLAGDTFHNHMSVWGNISSLTGNIRESRYCLAGRAANHYNVGGVEYPGISRGRDGTGVLLQFDSFCDRVHIGTIDCQNMQDDAFAWGVTNGGTFGDTTAPIGPKSMGTVVVDTIYGSSPTALLKAYCATGFSIGTVRIGLITGVGSIAIGDLSSGVSGGACDSFYIEQAENTPGVTIAQVYINNAWSAFGPLRISKLTDKQSNPNINNDGEALFVNCPFTTVEIDHLIANIPRTNSGVIKLQPTASPGTTLKIGNIVSTGAAGGFVLLARGTAPVENLQVSHWNHNGNGSINSGALIYSDVNSDFTNVEVTNLRVNGSQRIIAAMTAGLTRNWYFTNCTVDQIASVFGSDFAGTFNIWLANFECRGVANNLLQFGAASGQNVVARIRNAPVLSGGYCLFTGTNTIRLNGDDSVRIDLGANGGAPPTQLNPSPGDSVWNTNATGTGRYGRTTTPAWVKIF